MKKVMIFGAGNIGIAIAQMLPKREYYFKSYEVTVVDRLQEPASLSYNSSELIRYIEADITDYEKLKHLAKDQDVLVSALPFNLTFTIAKLAVDVGAHYVDMTEDVKTTESIKNLLNQSKIGNAFALQCGLAPGVVGSIAAGLISAFETVRDVELRVGALPKVSNNPLGYSCNWSVAGLVNEYFQDCEAIQNFVYSNKVIPLADRERVILEGVEYEAANTSGGLGDLCSVLRATVENVNYKTLRYKGHWDAVDRLLEATWGKVATIENGRERMDAAQKIMRHEIAATCPPSWDDEVVIMVRVNGTGSLFSGDQTYVRRIGRSGHFSAIQVATASGVCAMIDYVVEGDTKGLVTSSSLRVYHHLRTNRFTASVYFENK